MAASLSGPSGTETLYFGQEVFLDESPADPEEGKCTVAAGQILTPRWITVHAPEIRKEGLVPFHVYKITTAPSIVDHVFRRYKDFEWLRELLVNSFPGIFIPPLPPKSVSAKTGVISKKDDPNAEPAEVLVERQIGLQRFLARCSKVPILVNSPAMQLFLSRSQTFQEASKELSRNAGINMAKKMKDMVPSAIATFSEDSMEILHTYKDVFPQLMQSPLPENSEEQIGYVEEFMKTTEEKMEVLVYSTSALLQHVTAITKDLGKFNGHLQQLYTLERGYPECPKPLRVDIMDQMNGWHATMEKLAPSYKGHLLRVFQYELEDVRAFRELLKRRDTVRIRCQKAIKAASKWREAAAQPNETEKMRMQRTTDLAKEQEEQQLLDALTKLLLSMQIQQLWETKTATFKAAFAAFSKHQQKVAEMAVGVWQEAIDRIDQQ